MLLSGMRELRDRLAKWPLEWGGTELREMVEIACEEMEEFFDVLDKENRERYLKLPVDRDGKVWHVGDGIDLDGYGHTSVMAVNESGIYYWDHSGTFIEWAQADTKAHYNPNTVRSMLMDLVNKMCNNELLPSEARAMADEYAEKMTLKDEL